MSPNKLMRNYGWVQNTSNLTTVRDTIDLIPEYGIRHLELRELIRKFREENKDLPTRWTWDARCRIKAINACGLVRLDRNIQGYQLTDLGKRLKQCQKSNKFIRGKRCLSAEEIEIFRIGVLTNPPVIRVLDLLNQDRKGRNQGLSTYDIGSQLGFVGDPGFTHLDPNWIVANGFSFTNKEGDSDKWARTIISWLTQLGYVKKRKQYQNIEGFNLPLYSATPEIENVLRYSAKRIVKYVPSEMLCSDHHLFPKLIQKRRVLILKSLSKPVTINQIISELSKAGIESNEQTIKFELISLQQAGFRITTDQSYYKLADKIFLDIDPNLFSTNNEQETPIEKLIESLVVRYEKTIPVRLVDNLIRYSSDGSKGTNFESTIAQFFTFLGYSTKYLGQGTGRNADVLAKYIEKTYARSYALIIDAKASSNKYSFPINDVRKMKEYILKHGPDLLKEGIPNHAFIFTSSDFVDNVTKPLKEIYRDTHIRGSALLVTTLLELGNLIKQGKTKISDIYNSFTINDIYNLPI